MLTDLRRRMNEHTENFIKEIRKKKNPSSPVRINEINIQKTMAFLYTHNKLS